jgi:hypothetical protein
VLLPTSIAIVVSFLRIFISLRPCTGLVNDRHITQSFLVLSVLFYRGATTTPLPRYAFLRFLRVMLSDYIWHYTTMIKIKLLHNRTRKYEVIDVLVPISPGYSDSLCRLWEFDVWSQIQTGILLIFF